MFDIRHFKNLGKNILDILKVFNIIIYKKNNRVISTTAMEESYAGLNLAPRIFEVRAANRKVSVTVRPNCRHQLVIISGTCFKMMSSYFIYFFVDGSNGKSLCVTRKFGGNPKIE